MMNAEIKAEWVAALRSGDYKQGKGSLRRPDASGAQRYCCLGVLCELAVKAEVIQPGRKGPVTPDFAYGEESEIGVLPSKVRAWAGLASVNPQLGDHCAGAWNDTEYAGFGKIADLIEEHL